MAYPPDPLLKGSGLQAMKRLLEIDGEQMIEDRPDSPLKKFVLKLSYGRRDGAGQNALPLREDRGVPHP